MNIGIIGGGPRGLITLSHLVQNFQASSSSELTIDIFDPYPAGGQVWRVDQPIELIMNTIASDITLFDHRHQVGPSLSDWANHLAPQYIQSRHLDARLEQLARQLTPNGYAPRALVGAYAQWFYDQLIANLPTGVNVNYHLSVVNNITKNGDQWTIKTDDEAVKADQVVFTINASAHQRTTSEQSLHKYADEHHLYYQAPAYPGDIANYHFAPHQNVIIRGLGMSFFDEIIKLTVGQGGQFKTDEHGQLKYLPSGNEPHLFAGSRRGVPYYPKAVVNDDYQFTSHFVTDEQVAKLKNDGHITVNQFQQLMRHEIELTYYQLILKQHHPEVDVQQFTTEFVNNPDAAVDNAPFQPNELLRWPQLLNPVAGTPITTTADYQQTLLNWLKAVASDATAGLGKGPLATALTTFKEVRATFRKVIGDHDFTNDDYVENFLTGFKANSQLLSNGAPAIRFHQLIALMNAGIVTILGPQMNVIGANQHFVAMSKFYPKEPVIADALIEARIPKLNLAADTGSLTKQLVNEQTIQPAAFKLSDGKTVQINAIQINATDQAVNSTGQVDNGLIVFSTMTEGIHWLTTVFPMMGLDDNHESAEQISRQLLSLPSSQSDSM
ncbi:FAD/NAD(P)-binding protein [Nicoliella lavandulae]|uniref:FAD/NAD(P)-binding protein n=1 Tax=Nicoliella lavandulae TaxID=3082954 RepID=A0ABU8SIH9_9LACO